MALRKLLCLVVLCPLGWLMGQGQTGSIQGVVKDKDGDTLPFANVTVEQSGATITIVQTDIDGNYKISPLDPGTYDVKGSYAGYKTILVEDVIVQSDKFTKLDFVLPPSFQDVEEVEVVVFSKPLIDPDFKSGGVTTREEIMQSPLRSVTSIASNVAGMQSKDDGSGQLNVRGTRNNSTYYYIDGIKVRGSASLPQSGIEQVSVITGGVPAEYGDVTGGIISVTTRGPQPKYSGGIDLLTSEYLDEFGFTNLEFNASGPLLRKKNDEHAKPILGFFIAGNVSQNKDARPSVLGTYQLKDDVLSDLEQNPLRRSPDGNGTLYNSYFVTKDDMEESAIQNNAGNRGARLMAKLDFKPGDAVNISMGGNFSYSDKTFAGGSLRGFEYNLFAADNRGLDIRTNVRAFARITHMLSKDGVKTDGGEESEEDQSGFKNVFYTLHADYSLDKREIMDKNHKDNLFKYGHIGRYTTEWQDVYEFRDDIDTLGITNASVFAGLTPVSTSFERAETNPLLANYTDQYYTFYEPGSEEYQSLDQIQLGGALLNGQNPRSVYSLWFNTGNVMNYYQKRNAEQFRLVMTGNADYKRHSFKMGFEFEQRIDRQISMNPMGLWGLMRQLSNAKNSELDVNNPVLVYDDWGIFQDTVYYNWLYNPEVYNDLVIDGFFENIRDAKGASSLDKIYVDEYDPEDFSLSMFTPDELLNGGLAPNLSYYGYDYTGKNLSNNNSLSEFFTGRSADGRLSREIGAFQPIYMAGYIQDKFSINDIVFNVGVRVDRYDANQLVMKDKYSLYAIRTAAEVEQSHPANIGDDYKVYVDDNLNPNPRILGYRNGDVWYDAQGTELNDPYPLASGSSTGEITPYLVDPNADILSDDFDPSTSFEDYKPTINVMPRISLSFPISDEAQFFAHYDILTKRPNEAYLRFDPIDFLFLKSKLNTTTFNNPNLQPERTTDYELGFAQKLSAKSALTLSAFYKEIKNQINIVRVNYAAPASYTTFGNVDFGTVKGFTVGYDQRRTGNISFNVNYTMQFAYGTGSDETSAGNLVNSGMPNLRTLTPLSYDQRHNIKANMDYRFRRGKGYNGPMALKSILEDMGLNINSQMVSGTPYSRQKETTQDAMFGIANRSTLDGEINGSRLPWQVTINASLNKNFSIKMGGDAEEGDDRKTIDVNAYLQVLNVLDAKNVSAVYRATGSADTDGYLESVAGQKQSEEMESAQAFRDMYSIKLMNPDRYLLPRRIRFGIQMNF